MYRLLVIEDFLTKQFLLVSIEDVILIQQEMSYGVITKGTSSQPRTLHLTISGRPKDVF